MAEFKNMKQIPKDERPYEKCVRLGAQSLTDAELLAVLLRTGTVGSPSVHMAEEILSLSKRQKGASGTSHFKPCTIKIRKRYRNSKSNTDKMHRRAFQTHCSDNSQERASVYPARNHCGLLHGAAAPQGTGGAYLYDAGH